MHENLFKDSQCPIESVPKADFDFVNDVCAIPKSPPPIYGCVTPIIPREPFTEVGPICPEFSTVATLDVGYEGDDGSGCIRVPAITFSVEKIDVDPCQYDLKLDLAIPIPRPPCPTLTSGNFNLEVGYQDCVTATNTLSITKIVTPGDCNTADECEFVLDLDLRIPIPRPVCPQIYVNTFSVNSGYSDATCMVGKQNTFTVTPITIPGDCDSADQCSFALDVEIAIPLPRVPCPQINVTEFEVATGFATNSAGESCLDDKSNFFSITPTIIPGDGCNVPDSCSFDLALGIAIPIPRTPCPIINRKKFEVNSGFYGGALTSELNCLTDKENVFEITSRVIPGDCNTADQCEFDFDVSIVVPIPLPPCPIISVLPPVVTTGYNDPGCHTIANKFEVTTKHVPPTNCNDPGQCEFSFELAIDVPIPRPPCPIITARNFSVTVGYNDAGYGGVACHTTTNELSITPDHRPPSDCNDPGECQFNVDLILDIPIPRPPCPVINVAAFSVATLLRDPNNPTNDCCSFDLEVADIAARRAIPRAQRNVGMLVKTITPAKRWQLTVNFADGISNDTPFWDELPCETNSFTITTSHVDPADCNDPGECNFDVSLVLSIPVPLPPCPVLSANSFEVTTAFVNDPVDETCLTDKFNRFDITTTIVPGDCNNPGTCQYDFDVAVLVPIPRTPCPIINTAGFSVTTGFGTYGGSGATDSSSITVFGDTVAGSPIINNLTVNTSALTVGMTVAGSDIPTGTTFLAASIDNPHQIMISESATATSVAVQLTFTGSGEGTIATDCLFTENRFEITPRHIAPIDCTDPGQCEFDVDLVIAIPIPRIPCPDIRVKGFSVSSGYAGSACVAGKRNTFEITPAHVAGIDCTDPGQCAFDVIIDIVVPIPKPPCPTIRRRKFTQKVQWDTECATEESKFVIESAPVLRDGCNTPDGCNFNVDLELVIPVPIPPCPELNVNTFDVITGYEGSTCVTQNSNVFNITPKLIPNECGPPTCSFDIDLQIVVPIPSPPCIEINKKSFNTYVGFAGTDCVAGKTSNLSIKKTIKTSTDCGVPKETCDFDIELDIVVPLPLPVCPVITGQLQAARRFADAAVVTVNNTASFMNITPYPATPTCSSPGQCGFFFDLFIDIPTPRLPCPQIVFTRRQFNTRAGYNELLFDIRPAHTPNTGTNNAPECKFEVDFDLRLNIIPPVCTPIVFGPVQIQRLPASEAPWGYFNTAGSSYNAEAGSCLSVANLTLAIPIPCETKVTAMPGNVIPDDREDKIELIVYELEKCDYRISPLLRLRKQKCPTWKSSDVKIEPRLTSVDQYGNYIPFEASDTKLTAEKIEKADERDCEYQLKFEAKPKVLSGSKGGVSDKTDGGSTLGDTYTRIQPDGLIYVDVVLKVTDCPATSSGGGGGTPGADGQRGPSGVPGTDGRPGQDGQPGRDSTIAGPVGATGPRGFPGFGGQGPQGPQGPQGDQGISGPRGEQGFRGFQGLQGNQGPQGEMGPTGCIGITGMTGPSGMSGPTGSTGVSGATGPVGPSGLVGATGISGPRGASGPQGDDGPQGDIGATGVSGPEGIEGPEGPQGLKGDTGSTGPSGIQGISGVKGATGIRGPSGATGEKGMTGATGLEGNTGPSGARGPSGPQGPQGPQGRQGIQGLSGPVGATGVSGIQGASGVAGPSGPKGLTGVTGATGVSGPSGPRGESGAVGGKGATGATGFSGPSGPAGSQGPQGATGASGLTGHQGATGVAGAAGLTGARGATGAAGTSGATGRQGATGASGVTGATGVTGSTGPAGATGPCGINGINGINGAVGATGPRAQLSAGAITSTPAIFSGNINAANDTLSAAININLTLLATNEEFQAAFIPKFIEILGRDTAQSQAYRDSLTPILREMLG